MIASLFFFNFKGGYYKLAGPVKMQTLIQGVWMGPKSHISHKLGVILSTGAESPSQVEVLLVKVVASCSAASGAC